MKIALVSCSGAKLKGSHSARDLYQSALFKAARRWAESNCDSWLVLSAKYGVLYPDDVIHDYDETLRDKTKERLESWAAMVRRQLILNRDDVLVSLAGDLYTCWADGGDFHMQYPLKGLGIGYRLQWLKLNAKRKGFFDAH